jgi:SHS2 domain-containing protein
LYVPEKNVGKSYSILNHTADTGIVAYGTDLKQAFANAAKGMFSLITDLRKISERTSKTISLTATDREMLLVSWLNELIYLFDTEQMLFKRFEITELTDTILKARAYGEKANPGRHTMKIGIKSTTYHMLQVSHNDGFQARVIFDI